jgi:hypothetical protein
MEKIDFYPLWEEVFKKVAERNGWDEQTPFYTMDNISLYTPVGEGADAINGVLIFADGTIEFHLEEDGDAYNWSEFTIEDNDAVLQQVRAELDSYLNGH